MASTSVMWFRRDLRLADNPALLAACEADRVLPLFVLDPRLWSPAGLVRRAYLVSSLTALTESMGGALVVRSGDPREVLPAVAEEVGADRVHIASDFGPYGSRRDTGVQQRLAERGVELRRLGSPYAVAPGTLVKADGEPFKVYSPFFRAWDQHGTHAPAARPVDPAWLRLDGEELPEVELPEGFDLRPAGEATAQETWSAFRESRLDDYREHRNLLGVQGTSRMSTYLKWGEIHPRTILADLAGAESASATTYRKELAWREFYADVLWRAPDSARQELRREFTAMHYDDPDERLRAWEEGRTGYPIVDAGMRQMRSTGFMHNRVRMITASFLVKDLHLSWRLGAQVFMKWLACGELASNNHGWQWVAGTGTDPAPYYRVFNPTLQGRKFDPDGTYIRTWVPELAHLPATEIHEPRNVPGYPAPIVDHAQERTEALLRYQRVRSAGA